MNNKQANYLLQQTNKSTLYEIPSCPQNNNLETRSKQLTSTYQIPTTREPLQNQIMQILNSAPDLQTRKVTHDFLDSFVLTRIDNV